MARSYPFRSSSRRAHRVVWVGGDVAATTGMTAMFAEQVPPSVPRWRTVKTKINVSPAVRPKHPSGTSNVTVVNGPDVQTLAEAQYLRWPFLRIASETSKGPVENTVCWNVLVPAFAGTAAPGMLGGTMT
jgi:hypothetical protein